MKFLKNYFNRSYILLIILVMNLFFYQFAVMEYKSYKFLVENRNVDLLEILDSKLIINRTYEDVMIRLLDSRQLDLANQFALKLVSNDVLCGPAYYVKSVYYESIKDGARARSEIQKALKIDKFNDTYLIAASVIELRYGDINVAKNYLEKAKLINPNRSALQTVETLIKQQVTENAGKKLS